MLQKIKQYFTDRKAGQIEKSLKHIKNPKAIKEDRHAAIEFFCSYPDDEVATKGLLQRFQFSLEHGINDAREKEQVLKGLVKRGESIIPLIVEHLKSTSRIAWPIKALNQIAKDESTIIEALKSCLDFGDITFDQAKVDKNYDILCYLRDYQLPGFFDNLVFFLSSPDERVRFSAIEVILEQDDPRVPEIAEKYLIDTSAENTRLRQAALDAFADKQWPLKDPEAFQSVNTIGFTLDGKNRIQRSS